MEKITAKNNARIKYAVKLYSDSSFRKKAGEFMLEGARLCSDAAAGGITIETAFFTPDAPEKYRQYAETIINKAKNTFEITEELAHKLSDTESSQGVFCICAFPETGRCEAESGGKYLALENVQDPSNLGAIMRSAEAMGLDGVIVCGGCDIYNPKALRAAMGSSLRLNVIQVQDAVSYINSARQKGFKVYASVPDSNATDIRLADKSGSVIVFAGNEGNGLTRQTILACDDCVTIPMQGRAESFNVSAAAAILAWELKR